MVLINTHTKFVLLFCFFVLINTNNIFGKTSEVLSERNDNVLTFSNLRNVNSTISEDDYLNFIRTNIIKQPEYLFAISEVAEKNMSLKFANRLRWPDLSFQVINDESIDRDVDDIQSIRKRRDDSFDASIELSQPIYTGGSINAKVGIARNEFSISKILREEALSNQILRANEVYLAAATSDLLYNYGRNILNEVKPYLEKVKERVSIGISDPIQLAIFSIKYNDLESKIQILRTNRNRDVGVYEYFFNTKFENIYLPEVNVPYVNYNKSSNAYSVENSILSHKAQKEETKLTRSEYLPQFGLRARYTQYDLDEDENDTDIRGGIYFSFPVFTFGRASARISSSKAKEKASQFKIDVERKNDDVLETEIVNIMDSSHNTRIEIFKSFNDTRQQRKIIRDRIEITDFSPTNLIESGIEELNQLQRLLTTETTLLHGYMLYLHQNRGLTSFVRIQS